MRLGLIVNPIAGIGGSVGFKGSDGRDTASRAMELGAVSPSPARTVEALQGLAHLRERIDLIAYPLEMGEDEAREGRFLPRVLGSITKGRTTAADTKRAARHMVATGVDLLLFAGGDGTARDICDAVGNAVPVLGIPAGVKMHSSVFATSPKRASMLVEGFVQGSCSLAEMEVMDVDEEAFRMGTLHARLYGHLDVPYERGLLQGPKEGSTSASDSLEAIGSYIADNMEDTCYYILGPGTTVRAVCAKLGLDKTLLGIDVVIGRQLVAKDANETQILKLIEGHMVKAIVGVVGGQGYILGRGNQQISPRVLREVGKENLVVVAARSKLLSLPGPLLVDTGDREWDATLSGYARVVTGYNEESVWRVES